MGRIARRKVLRDLWLARGRTAVLVVAMAVSLIAVGAVLSAYGILAREMPRSFLSSSPASATLVVHGSVDPALLDAIRRRPEIADAERRAMVRARIEVAADRWLPLTLFVVEDFDAMRVETVTPVEGAWPPPAGTMLLDRTSVPVLNTRVGAEMVVSTPNGQPRAVQVAGVVVDPGVAPAWQEQAGFGYITPATLAWLGEPADLDLLKVAFRDDVLDATANARTAQDLSAWLAQEGVAVEEIRIPPPGQHPHQVLMNELAVVLLLFSLLALALSGLLVATMVSAMLARHVRQIGAMKAIGGQPAHIALMYGAMVLAIGAAAVALAVVPGVVAGRALAAVYADLSNVELASLAVPWWVYAVVALAGLLTPLLAAAAPVVGASRMTVREAISEVGLYQGPTAGGTRSAGALAARLAAALGPTLVLALRHALRRRSRLALSLILLAMGGGTFMSGLNVAAASDRQLASGEATLGYDLELSLSQPQPTESLLRLVRGMPGVAYAESVGIASVAVVQPGEAPVARTHKDGGHGTQRLYALPPETRFPQAVQMGRWLEPGDVDAIVVPPGALEALGTSLGGPVSLSIAGRTTEWRVVGVLRRVGMGRAELYVSDVGFAQATGGPVGTTQGLRILTEEHDAAARQGAQRALEGALAAEGIGVAGVVDADWRNTVLRAHMAIVQGALQALGVVLGVVGALALASAMSLSVVERTREFGVMQTLGATPARVIWVVVAEALFIGALSWLAAVALAVLLSSLIGAAVGSALFGAPLPLVVSPVAVLAWLAVALLGSAAASAYPASAASRLTIRETLAYA
jgi:putative ABC transport system permease protein